MIPTIDEEIESLYRNCIILINVIVDQTAIHDFITDDFWSSQIFSYNQHDVVICNIGLDIVLNEQLCRQFEQTQLARAGRNWVTPRRSE